MQGHTTSQVHGQQRLLIANYNAESNHRPAAKTLAGAIDGSSELAAWFEQANQYYQAVISGAEPQPDASTWNEFMGWMQWAQVQLNSVPGAWDPMGGGVSNQFPSQRASDPFGAARGANGTWVHTDPSATFGFVGNDTRDVWSDDITVQVAPVSAKVRVEKTTDTRWNPPEDVLKITVTDRASGTEAVYFIHDYENAELEIQVPDESQVEDLTGEAGLIGIGAFEAGGSVERAGQSSIRGEKVEGSDNHYLYEGRAGTPLVFRPEGGKDEEIHEVFGDCTINARPSDRVTVSAGMPDEPEGYTVLVTHRDGSVDKYYIHKGYDVNLGAKADYITWVTGQETTPPVEGEHEGVPDAFRKRFSLNGSETGTGSDGKPGDLSSAHPEDTQPDRVENGEAHYTTSTKVDVHADHDDDIREHFITAPGEVVIHGADFTDRYKVTYDEAANEWTIYVYPGNDLTADPEIFHVTGGAATRVILDAIGENKLTDTTPEAKRRVQIGLTGAAPAGGSASSDGSTASERLAQIPEIVLTAEEIRERGEIISGQQTPGTNNNFNPDNLPAYPNGGVFDWLARIDPVLGHLLQEYRGTSTEEQIVASLIRNRLALLLTALYPDADIGIPAWDTATDPDADDDILFNGIQIDLVRKAESGPAVSIGSDWLQFEVVTPQGVAGQI